MRSKRNREKHAKEVGTSELPALVSGGVHHQRWSGGVVGSRNQSLDQHHPGASRHPSSS